MYYSTIIFDFDGTLADTFPQIFEVVNKIALENKMSAISPDQVDYFRKTPPMQLLKELKIPLYKLPFLIRKGQHMLSQTIQNVTFFPGIVKALKELKKRNIQLGILSSNSKENIMKVLEKQGVTDLFDFIHSELNLFGKHHSLEKIINKYKLKKKETLYVGDEIRDIEACKKAGIDVIAVSWGFNTREILFNYSPTQLIDDPSQLLKSVDSI